MFKLGNVLDEAFGIRCPYSILKGQDVLQAYDNEGTQFTTDNLNKTVFCGQNSYFNSYSLFVTNVNSRYV